MHKTPLGRRIAAGGRPTRTVESVTEEAAGKFARLADGLRGWGVDPQEATHFLSKLHFYL